MRFFLYMTVASAFCTGCWGQQWEIGGAAGYGFYRDLSVSRQDLQGKAGLNGGPIFSVVAGQHPFRYLSGELRYSYQQSDLKVSSGDTKVAFPGHSHIVHYDALLHATPKGSRIRPFVAFGGGIKVFQGTGEESAFQPLQDLAVLTRTREIQPMLSLGGGVRIRAGSHAFLRFDFRDYMTPFPSKLIAPGPGAKLNGWLHDFAPMVGISAFF